MRESNTLGQREITQENTQRCAWRKARPGAERRGARDTINARFRKAPSRCPRAAKSKDKAKASGRQLLPLPSDVRLGVSAEVSSWQIPGKQRDAALQTPRN